MPTSNNYIRGSTVITTRGRAHSHRHDRLPGNITSTKMYEYRKHRGATGRINAELVREHVRLLHEAHLPYSSIARASGVDRTSIDHIANGKWQEIHRNIATAILAVDWQPHPAQTRCLSIGAQRRARALARIGRPLQWQHQTIGVTRHCYWNMLTYPTISYDLWAAIRDLYNQYWDKPGTGTRGKYWAVRQGSPPPMAWDDDAIDNPWAGPAETPKEFDPRQARRMERMETVQTMLNQGLSARTIADKLGVSVWTVDRDRVALREAA